MFKQVCCDSPFKKYQVYECRWLSFSKTYVEDFETGDIQYTDEVLSLLFGVKGLVTLLDEIFENPVEHGLRHGTHGIGDLVDITALGDELGTDLDPGLAKSVVQSGGFNTQQFGDAFTFLERTIWQRVSRRKPRQVLPRYRHIQPALHDLFV